MKLFIICNKIVGVKVNCMRKNIIIGVVGVLLVVGVGISFAYFVSEVLFSGSGSSVTATTGDMIQVIYDAGDAPLNGSGLIPGDSVSKDFTVTVIPTDTEKEATYGVFLDITNNSFVKCDDTNYNDLTNICTKDAEELTYTITDKDSNTVLATGDLTGATGKIKLLTETKTVDTETPFNYTITITFKDTGADQNHNQNKTFTGDVVVEFSEKEKTASEIIADALQIPEESINENQVALDEAGNARYIGADPNNYVYFNCDDYNNPSTCELWRIIGVFSEDTHGRSGEKLVKLIRDESIGEYAWDNKPSGIGSSTSRYGSNDWSDARLMMLLNPGYENPNGNVYAYEGSLYYNAKSGTCYSGSNGATKTCDFTTTGLKNDTTREMIETVTWKLGGSSTYDDVTASMFYERERGETVYSNHETTWEGKIGLMYPSDYGYATSGGSTTNRTSCLAKELYNWRESAGYSDCYNNDWLYDSSDYQWTLTSISSSSSGVFFVLTDGLLANSVTYYGIGVRPSVYLKSNIAISGGEGTSGTPYTIK